MADSIDKKITILFEGIDNTSGTIKGIGSNVEDFGKSVGDIAGPLASLGDSILTIDKYLAALAIGGMAYATIKAIELESSIVGLDKVLSDQEQKSLPQIVERMSEFADAYGFTAAEAVASAGEFRKAAFVLDDAAHLAELAAKLVVGAGEANFQMGQSTATLTALLKGFRVEQEDVVEVSTHMADVLNKLADEYAVSVSSLSEGLVILAPIADGLGFSFDEMAGLLVPAIEIFGSGSEAANGMKTALNALSKPTKQVSEIFDRFNISLTDSSGNQKQVKQLLDELVPSFVKLSKAEQQTVAATIAGSDQSAKFSAVLKGMNVVLEATEVAATKASGSLEKELVRGLATAEVQVKRFVAAFNNLSARIGIKFLESTKDVTKGSTDILIALRKIVESGGFKDIFDLINVSGKEISTLLEGIAKNLPAAFKGVDFKGIADSLDDLKKNIFDIFDDIDLSTASGLQEAIQLVVDSIDTLIQITDGILTAWQPFFDLIGDTIDYFNDMDDATKESVGNLLGVAQQVVLFSGALAASGLVIKAFATGLGVFGTAAKVAAVKVGLLDAAALAGAPRLRDASGKFVKSADNIKASGGLFKNAGANLSKGIKSISAALVGPAGFTAASAAAVAAAGAIGYSVGTLINKIPGVQKSVQELFASFTDNETFKFTLGDTVEDLENKRLALDRFRENINKFIDEAPTEPIKIDVELDQKRLDALEKTLQDTIKKQQDELRIKLRLEADKESLKQIPKDVRAAVSAAGLDDTGREAFIKINVELDEKGKKLAGEIDDINTRLFKLTERKAEIEIVAAVNVAGKTVTPNELALEFKGITEEIDTLTAEKKVIQLGLEGNDSFKKLEKAKNDLDIVTDARKIIRLKTEVNEGKGLGEVVSSIEKLADDSWKIELKPELQGKGVKEVEEKIDELTETKEFLLKIRTKELEEATKRIIASTEANAQIIEANLEFKATIRTAELEIDKTKIEKVFDGLSNTISAVTQSTDNLFGSFSQDFDPRSLWAWRDQLRQNMEIQKVAADDQHNMNEEIKEELRLRNQLTRRLLESDEPMKFVFEGTGEWLVDEIFRQMVPKLQLFGLTKNLPIILKTL